jgi:hypothetical protein
LRSLDTAATPGPWLAALNGHAVNSGSGHLICYGSSQNVALVAAMRNAWPEMVTLLEGLLVRHTGCVFGPDCPDMNAALAVLDTLDPP